MAVELPHVDKPKEFPRPHLRSSVTVLYEEKELV